MRIIAPKGVDAYMKEQVVVVIGVGGMGEAIARRLGSGRMLLLADANEETLQRVSDTLDNEGYRVCVQAVDVSSRGSVHTLAQAAARLGDVVQVAHTAGVSPAQANSATILRVDLLGVALMLDELANVIAPGGAGVVISSMASHLATMVPPEIEAAFIRTPTDALLDLPFLKTSAVSTPGVAYVVAKRANVLRVMAASATWGARGARINSISPGIISTPMQQEELLSPSGRMIRELVSNSALRRMGTSSEIAEAAAFLLGPSASFITGTDLLVDAGAVAGMRSLGMSA